MNILVTGGAGYIGSHTVLCLLEHGYDVIVLDNYSNSFPHSLEVVRRLSGRDFITYEGDVRNRALLANIFTEHKIDLVIHFAGLKAVGESVCYPITYYDNNLIGTLALIEEMKKFDVKNIIFSSSATVYGTPESIPLFETSKVGGTTNPYGTSKLMVEQILEDVARAAPTFRATVLRYFNPVGAHPSGELGEDPNGVPTNIMPFICQVAVGKHKHVSVFGNDYPTKDGTGVRDFIHVLDLAEGHLAAVEHSDKGPNYKVYNLGTGVGYSVLELLVAFKRNTGVDIRYQFIERRPGDIAECWSNPGKAYKELGWRARQGLDQMICDAWNWQQKNPDGFRKG